MPALDGLRALAITLVVAYHAALHVAPGYEAGRIGVDVFFALSGFLITSLIAGPIQTGGFERRRFYVRRAIRLVPALVVTVVVFTLPGAIVMGPWTWVGAAAALLYVAPFMPVSTIFGATWTLAVEEWFYLAWPVVLAKVFRDRLTMRQVAALAATLAIAMESGMIRVPGSIAVRPSALLAGAALALWWLAGGTVRRPSLVLAIGITMVLVGGLAGDLMWGPMSFWLAVAGTVAVCGAVACRGGGLVLRVLELRPFVAAGVVSYEWYLVHAPVIIIAFELWGPASLWWSIPLSLAVAFALHHSLAPLQSSLRGRATHPVAVSA